MAADEQPLSKVHPDQFRKVVERGGDELVTVLVEVHTPLATVEFDREAVSKGFGSPRPMRIAPAKSGEATANVVKAVEGIVGAIPARPYGSSSVLVVDATFDQIRRIAELDQVKEVWLNERAAKI